MVLVMSLLWELQGHQLVTRQISIAGKCLELGCLCASGNSRPSPSLSFLFCHLRITVTSASGFYSYPRIKRMKYAKRLAPDTRSGN